MNRRALLLLLGVPGLAAAQTPSDSCSCARNLGVVIEKTEANYAGFDDKTSGPNQARYQSLVRDLRAHAPGTSGAACFDLIARYVRFFRDKHLQFYDSNPAHQPPKQTLALTEAEARARVKTAPKSSPLGIYQNPDGKMRFAVLPDAAGRPGRYRVAVLASQNPDVPAGRLIRDLVAYRPDGFLVEDRNASMRSILPNRMKLVGNLLHDGSFDTWTREFPHPATEAERQEAQAWLTGDRGMLFRELAPDVGYLKLPNMTVPDERVQALLEKHRNFLDKAPYLIVDIRNDGGGNSPWGYLVPLLYTGPIHEPPQLFRASPDNLAQEQATLAYRTGPDSTQFARYLDQLRQNPGKLVPQPMYQFPEMPVLANPKRVAILVNEFCGSSAEYFIQFARRHSKKVTVFGTHTLGMMDYGDLRGGTPLPCPDFQLILPMARSSWTATRPIDGTGLAPDVQLAGPEGTWVEQVVKKWRE